jgi:L-ribulose-5-phosphate 3-epimerase
MRLGIIQGRLLPPVNNKIQEFPKDNWQQEFDILTQVDLNHIEFIVTKDSFSDFTGLSLKNFSNRISAVCCDNIIDEDFYKLEFLTKQLIPICELAKRDGIQNINIPLLEQSSLTEDNFEEFSRNILEISNTYDLNFNFEIESPLEVSLSLVNLSDRFYFIYDTGNLNYIKVDHKDYIENIILKISQVHLKDRDSDGSHYPGSGTTNFKLIFDLLRKYNFSGPFTIQTKRGDSGLESKTIQQHSLFFKTLWNSFI